VPTNVPDSSDDCPFCEIVNRNDRDVREVYRDGDVVVFFPDEPATLGHTLVVPRRHVSDIWSLDPDLAGELGKATVKVANAVKRAMQPDGLNVIQSNGDAATQTVMHLHIHVVPRWHNDRIGRIWPPESSYSEIEKDAAWEAIRLELRRVSG
jgi:histidine triad (HIT) family protein